MKTKILWSSVVLCGFVGAWVAYMGGWTTLIAWHPILITRVVWQTNYTSAVEDPWAVKTNITIWGTTTWDNMPAQDDGLPPPAKYKPGFIRGENVTNNIIVNSNIWSTFTPYITNIYFTGGMLTNYNWYSTNR